MISRQRTCVKAMAGRGTHLKYRVPSWLRTKQWLSRFRKPAGSRQTYGSGTEDDPYILSSPTDDHNPADDPFFDKEPTPVTPQRSSLSPRPPIHRTPKSAPALLERSRVGDPGNTPSRKRGKAKDTPLLSIDKKISDELAVSLSSKQRKERSKLGNVYLLEVIFEDNPQKTILKIGQSTATEERLKRIRNECSNSSIKQGGDPEDRPIILRQKAESLAHAELSRFNYRFKCECGTAHREYFDVDKAAALEVIQRWRDFCESGPYDVHGNLLTFWDRRLDHYLKLRDEFDNSHKTLTEAGRLRIRWKRFSSVSQFRISCFNVAYQLNKVWPWIWPAFTLFEALVIAHFTYSTWLSPFAWVVVVVVAACIGVEWSRKKCSDSGSDLPAWVMDWTSGF
ncbi:hypothetical protein F5Y10DRAFT_253463 [Nemania abortiva]|nr:hypothetical protein F5Y10DRAFT_253463 [Nemania abortiva]